MKPTTRAEDRKCKNQCFYRSVTDSNDYGEFQLQNEPPNRKLQKTEQSNSRVKFYCCHPHRKISLIPGEWKLRPRRKSFKKNTFSVIKTSPSRTDLEYKYIDISQETPVYHRKPQNCVLHKLHRVPNFFFWDRTCMGSFRKDLFTYNFILRWLLCRVL